MRWHAAILVPPSAAFFVCDAARLGCSARKPPRSSSTGSAPVACHNGCIRVECVQANRFPAQLFDCQVQPNQVREQTPDNAESRQPRAPLRSPWFRTSWGLFDGGSRVRKPARCRQTGRLSRRDEGYRYRDRSRRRGSKQAPRSGGQAVRFDGGRRVAHVARNAGPGVGQNRIQDVHDYRRFLCHTVDSVLHGQEKVTPSSARLP